MQTTLEHAGRTIDNPTDADIAEAIEGPRDADWFLSLSRGEDDFMEVMVDAGELWVETEVEGRYLQARSHVDEAAVKTMLSAFRDGAETWRDLAAWREPPPASKNAKPPKEIMVASAMAGGIVLLLGVTALVTGHGGWVGLAFALTFPGVIAVAVAVKKAEIARAAKWNKGTARIVTSAWVMEKRYDKEVKTARVAYEFTVAFHPWRGRRVSFAEVIAGPDAAAVLARYPVGASVPVYYDPADPSKSVLERDPPAFFKSIYPVLAAVAAVILAVGLWLLLG